MKYFEVRSYFEGVEDAVDDNTIPVKKWWTDDAIAAYQFKGASSQSKALKDKTGNGYDLSRTHGSGASSPSWTTANGFYFNNNSWLTNSALNKRQDIKTIIVRMKSMPNYKMVAYPKGSSGNAIIYNPVLCYGATIYTGTAGWQNYSKPIVMVSIKPPEVMWGVSDEELWTYASMGKCTLTYYEGASTVSGTGVLACTNKKIFFNGVNQNATKKTVQLQTNQHNQFGTTPCTLRGDGGYILAAAFYNKVLSDSKINDISEVMAEI